MTNPTWVRPTTKYLAATLRDVDRLATLVDNVLIGTLAFSIDEGASWLTGEWDGAAYLDDRNRVTRLARTSAQIATASLPEVAYPVWVRHTNGSVIEILEAGAFALIGD